jgi:protein-S-isoprenylcysteine O-methyltransferase Ste14
MTVQQLVFNLGATVYFIIGAMHEERRLLSVFGEEYERYQRNVPGILPIKIR